MRVESRTQESRESEGAHSQMVKREGRTSVGHEDLPEGEDQKLDGTHLKGEQQGWNRQQDAEAEGCDGQTEIILRWGSQGNQHDWP